MRINCDKGAKFSWLLFSSGISLNIKQYFKSHELPALQIMMNFKHIRTILILVLSLAFPSTTTGSDWQMTHGGKRGRFDKKFEMIGLPKNDDMYSGIQSFAVDVDLDDGPLFLKDEDEDLQYIWSSLMKDHPRDEEEEFQQVLSSFMKNHDGQQYVQELYQTPSRRPDESDWYSRPPTHGRTTIRRKQVTQSNGQLNDM